MRSNLPVRGRNVALAALFVVLLGMLLTAVEADAQTPDTGGTAAAQPAQPVVAKAALAPGTRTAVTPLDAPAEVVAAVAAANQITSKPYRWVIIAGLRFDTSGRGEDGPRWRPEPRSGGGYVKRHVVGL